MSKYALLSDLPVPVIPRGKPRHEYPLGEMQVGQAFVVDLSGDGEEKDVDRMKSAISRWKKSTGQKQLRFTVAVIDHTDDLTGGVSRKVGVWRAADATEAAAQ